MQLFHYTDAQAVQSMLAQRKFWLTDLRFMNDSTELLHGIEFLRGALSEQPYGLFYDPQYTTQALDYLSTSLRAYEDAAHLEDPLFSMSFSEKDDLLSQWRGYGGYSVCFDLERLEKAGFKLTPCIYRTRSKLNRARNVVSETGAMISRAMAQHQGCIDPVSLDAVTSLIELAASFKDCGFEEEREVRMILRPDPSNIRFRPRNGILVPYIEIDIPEEAIVSVRVGPIREQALATLSMEMFINSVQSDHRNNGGNIEWHVAVEKSNTPYRT